LDGLTSSAKAHAHLLYVVPKSIETINSTSGPGSAAIVSHWLGFGIPAMYPMGSWRSPRKEGTKGIYPCFSLAMDHSHLEVQKEGSSEFDKVVLAQKMQRKFQSQIQDFRVSGISKTPIQIQEVKETSRPKLKEYGFKGLDYYSKCFGH